MPRSTNKSVKLSPLPKYPEIILALNHKQTEPPEFHWHLFVPNPGATREIASAGTKIHVVQRGQDRRVVSGPWFYECKDFTLGTSLTVAVAVVLGHMPAGKTVNDLIALLWAIPLKVPAVDAAREPKFTCRVWVREAVRRMHANGYIHCPDVDALEAEMLRHGREAARKYASGWFGLANLWSAVNSRPVQ